MGRLVVAAAGAVIGGYFGGAQGAQYGWAIGMAVGAATERPNRVQGPKIEDLRVTGVEYGQAIPWVKGHPIVAGQIWWASDRREIATTTEEGGKGGPGTEVTTYTYEVDLLIGLSENPIAGVSRIWNQGRLDYNVLPASTGSTRAASAAGTRWRRLTVYTGGASQLPDPTYETAVGAGNAPAYRGRGSVFIEGLQLGGSGQIPNLTFEVFTTGTGGGAGYSDNFAEGLSPYTTVVSGNISAFFGGSGPYGPTMYCQGRVQSGTPDEIRRSTPTCLSDGVRVKFRLADLADDDAAIIDLRNSGTQVFAFNPRREVAFDGLQRPAVSINGTSNSIGSGSLAANAWYQLEVLINSGANTSTAVITNLDDGTTAVSATLTGTFTPITLNQQGFYIDSTVSAPTTTTEYADLQVLPARAAITEETVQSTVEALCLRAGLTAGQVDATALSSITQPMRGLALTQVAPTRSAIEVLQTAYFFDAVLSDKLYFRRRGGASVATVPWADLGASTSAEGAAEPLALRPGSEIELPAGVAVRYMNADADAAADLQQADRLVSAVRTVTTVELPLLLTAAEAKAIADVMLLDMQVRALASTRISLLASYARLEPADVVTATAEDGSTFRLFLGQKTDADGVLTFDAVLDDASVLTQAGITSTDYTGSTSVAETARTDLQAMDIAILRDADNDAGYYVAAKGSATPWPGAAAMVSPDDVAYSQAATITESAVIGRCTTTLGNWAGGNVFDEVNTVTVAIGSGALASAARADLLNSGANAFLIGGEIVQAATCTLVSAGVYTLSSLLRGRRGTEWAMTGHAANERVVLLRVTGLRRVAVATSEIGALRYLRGVTLGATLGTAGPQTITPAAVGLKPFSPVDLRTTASSGGDISVLLHLNGSDASVTFTDSSLNALSFSAVGNAQLDTAQSKFGGAALLCDGTGDSIKAAHHAAVDVPTGDFTIEFWVRFASVTTPVLCVKATSTGFYPYLIAVNGSGKITFAGFDLVNSSAYSIAGTTTVSTATWYHIAAVRDGSTFRLYVNGVQEGSATSSATLRSNGSDAIAIGGYDTGASSLNGHIDDFSFVKGRCKYTGGTTFTPPTSELADPAGATGDISLSWSRRTRLAENFNSSAHPLGEETEAYEVDIYADGTFATLKRTLSGLTAPAATYTVAQQTLDFGAAQSTLHVRIYQLSATVGRGYALQASI